MPILEKKEMADPFILFFISVNLRPHDVFFHDKILAFFFLVTESRNEKVFLCMCVVLCSDKATILGGKTKHVDLFYFWTVRDVGLVYFHI
jgi:hypothetical protein